MSAYTDSFKVRYETAPVAHQTEVAVMHAVMDINNEDAGAPDHANRLAWAKWANGNSPGAMIPFMWPVSMNPAIAAAVAADPSGATVPDGDVQFVVNSNVDWVIAEWIKENPQTPA